METIVVLFMIALASASISFTITSTSIFLWLRELIAPVHHKLEELIHCPWCLSHYITLGLLFVFDTNITFTFYNVCYFILQWFAIQGIIGLLHYVYLRAYEPVAKAMMRRELEKLQRDE